MTDKQSITALDVSAWATQIKLRMAADPTFTDYNFEGGGMAAIVRLLAMAANQQAFQDNMTFGEGFLSSASQRTNAAAAAQFLSYVPYNHRCATITVNVVVTPYDASTAPSQLTIDKKVKFAGAKDGAIYYFTVQDAVTVNLVDGVFTFPNITLIQGQWNYKTYSVAGSAISSYPIPSANVDIDHVIVQSQVSATAVEYNTYERYKSAFQLDQKAFLYFMELGLDGFYAVEFGDGYVAQRVEDGNVVYIQYLVTDGLLGNDITSITASTSIGGLSKIDVSLVSERSAGGTDPETIESMRKMAPLSFEAEGAAVTDSDYAVILKRISSTVSKARSYGGDTLDPPRPGFTYIAALSSTGNPFTALEKAALVSDLQKYNIGSITPVIVDPDLYYICPTVTVFWDPTLTALTEQNLKDLLVKNITQWGLDNIDNFGTLFDKQKLEYYVRDQEKSIGSSIVDVKYLKYFSPTPGYQESWWFYFNRSILAGTVNIVGFKPVGAEVDYTYDIIDRTGVLWLRKYNATTATYYDVSKAGTVDYDNGIVYLDTFYVSNFNTGGVSVVAGPSGLDQNVTSVQNQILELKNITIIPEVRYVDRA